MDAWLAGLYERYGWRYVRGALLGTPIVFGSVLVSIYALFPTVYFELDASHWALLVGAAIVVLLGGVALAAHLMPVAELRAWSDGDRSTELAERAGDWAFERVRQALLKTAIANYFVGIVLVPGAILEPLDSIRLIDYVETWIGASAAFVAGFAIVPPVIDLILRPVRASIPGRVPQRRATAGLARRLTTTVVAMSYIWIIAGGYLFTERSESGGDLLIVFALALLPAGLLAVTVLLLLQANVLGPIGDLAAGQSSVESGELSRRVPVTAPDELGELAAGFNRMLDGLRERDALRGANAELVAELRASRDRVVAAADESRRRVERDLHDGAQQSLVLLNLKLGLAERTAGEDPEAVGALLREARADLDRALEELRDLAHGIYPQVLTTDGLAAALADAADGVAIAVDTALDGAGRYPPRVEAAVYFCCQEALQNAAKHAGQDAKVEIRLKAREGVLRFEVADDGAGFDPTPEAGSAGLQNMADRIGALGGELTVESNPGAGTRVNGSVPLEA